MKIMILFFILFSSLGLQAYSVPGHIELSKLSFELLKFCKVPLELEIDAVVEFSGKEDSCPHEGSLSTRLVHWHFYNDITEQDIWLIDGVVRLSFHYRWNWMKESFKSASDLSDRSKSAGALLHFIQDVTNPSHVVPIYHGPGRSDKFDYYPIQSQALRSTFAENCDQLRYLITAKSPSDLLHETAADTIESLKQKIKVVRNNETQELSLGEAYWTEPLSPNQNFFGSYGILGNNFGKTEFKTHPYTKLRGPRATRRGFRYEVMVDDATIKGYAIRQQRRALIWGAAIMASEARSGQ